MYDDFKVANYSKALVSPELYARPLSRIFSGEVMDGLTVTPGTGLQVILAPGNTLVRYGSTAVASARIVSLVNNFSLTVATPDVSNPRLDSVVLYIDNSVNLPSGTPTAANLDGKGVAKALIVKGTAAATPSAPNATAIQAAVGAGNPYVEIARVRVNAGVSVIASNLITDMRDSVKLRAKNLDFNSGIWGEELARLTLNSGQTTATISFPSRKYITVLGRVNGTATTFSPILRFNSDAGNNYVFRSSINGAADTQSTSQSSFPLSVYTGAVSHGFNLKIDNPAAQEKFVNLDVQTQYATGAASIQDRREIAGRWVNSSASITSITITTATSSFSSGEIVVIGHD